MQIDESHYISILINEHGWQYIPERSDIALRKGNVVIGKFDALDPSSWYVHYYKMVGGLPCKIEVMDALPAWSAFVLANSTYHSLKHLELLGNNFQYRIWMNVSPVMLHTRLINHDKRARLLRP